MGENLKENFNKLKSLDWSKAVVSFYVVQMPKDKQKVNYHIYHVQADDNIRKKLRKVAINEIKKIKNIKEYEFITTDIDDVALGLKTIETPLFKVIHILENSPIHDATDNQQLLKSTYYMVSLTIFDSDESKLYCMRRISNTWTIRKAKTFLNAVLKNSMLIDIEEGIIFKIDDIYDYFSFDDYLFIRNKRNFEQSQNFLEGMKKNRDEMIQSFKDMDMFENIHVLKDLIGNNIRLLRKISQVKNAGYYKDPNFLEMLRKISKEYNWGLPFNENGKLIANKDNITIILRYLNNDRLTSLITKDDYFTDSKHKVSAPSI